MKTNMAIRKSINPFSELRSCTKIDHIIFAVRVYDRTASLDCAIEYFEDERGKKFLQYIDVKDGKGSQLSWHGENDGFSFFSCLKDFTEGIFGEADVSTLSALNHSITDHIKRYCARKIIRGMH